MTPEPDVLTGEPRSGCPVIHLDTVRDRPVGEWAADLDELREASPIFWNEHGEYWVLTRASMVREVIQNAAVFTNDSITPGDPDPAYKWQWYPLPGVEHCAGASLDWTPVGANGSVFTFTVVRRPFLPGATKGDVPLTTVLVELDDAPGVRLVGRLADAVDPCVGTRVTAVFDHDGDVDDVRFTASAPLS